MNSKTNNYTIISDSNTQDGIKGIDISLATTPISSGGLRWLFVKNKWFKSKFLWQSGLYTTLVKGEYEKVIFLGNIHYLSTWLAIIHLKLNNKKVIFWTHGVTSNEKGVKWFVRKLFYNLGDSVLLYGHNAKKTMIDNGFPKGKLNVIYNSLDYNKQLLYRKQITNEVITTTKSNLFRNPDLPYVVFVGRLTPQKQLEMLVEAVKICFNNSLQFNTLFVGKGESKDTLEALTKKYKLENYVNFYGPCYDEKELSKLIGSADLCVSPGEVGLTAMTSLGYGTPVLSHDDFNNQMPEYEAIMPGINGELFERGNIEDLACKIESWLKYASNVTRKDIQNNCFLIIDDKYNPKNQVTIIDRVI
jgi:glycosyltransferase involved in cell wall biosynthesis